MNDENVHKALAELTSENPAVARAALDRLYLHSQPSLLRYLRRQFTPQNPDDCEEAIQDAFIKIGAARAGYRAWGIRAWHKYIQTIAVRCYLDRLRQRKRDMPPESFDDPSGPEVPPAVADFPKALQDKETVVKILHAADVLWLGIPAELSPEQRTRQVLAAQWFYLEGLPFQEVIDLLGPPLPGEAALTRNALDTWLSHEGVLRAMIYEVLHYANNRLAWHMLGHTGPVQTGKLDALCREIAQGVVSQEAAIILYHYRYGMSAEDIAARITPAMEEAQVQKMLDSLRAHLPFKSQMHQVLARLEPVLGAQVRDLVCKPGLWHRLAFQCSYADALGQKDVMERLQPCAEVAGYELTPATLNMWLSGRRLSSRLVRYYSGHEEGA